MNDRLLHNFSSSKKDSWCILLYLTTCHILYHHDDFYRNLNNVRKFCSEISRCFSKILTLWFKKKRQQIDLLMDIEHLHKPSVMATFYLHFRTFLFFLFFVIQNYSNIRMRFCGFTFVLIFVYFFLFCQDWFHDYGLTMFLLLHLLLVFIQFSLKLLQEINGLT